ncbi:hypothetical protein [Mumia sp. Pv 4-285]|uniref:hypothetical protein n=1 Tax=Mumia qirimensis TaxID=3234852 RepID=UPI00351D901D
MRTPEDDAALLESYEAELRGDAAAALDAMRRTFYVVGSRRPATLEYLARLGDSAPEWLIARWLRDQAYGWMMYEGDLRVGVAAKYATLTHGVPDLADEPLAAWFDAYAPRVAASDTLCQAFALYDGGGLASFLDQRASPALIDRAGRVREWSDAPLQVYELSGTEGEVLIVRDHASGREHRTLHVGAAVGNAPGDLVLGRLVPIETAPGLMFERRPMLLDRVTADSLVEVLDEDDPVPLCAELLRAADEGRLPYRPGTRVSTMLWSDLLDDPSRGAHQSHASYEDPYDDDPLGEVDDFEDGPIPGRVRDYMDAGLQRDIAEALCTCEMALDMPKVVPGSIGVLAQHAIYNLANPLVYEAARRHLVRPGDADGWEAIARCVPEPSRSQCLELAELARAA